MLKLRETNESQAARTPYAERKRSHDLLLDRVKSKYKLSSDRPLFTGLHRALARVNSNVLEHAQKVARRRSIARGTGREQSIVDLVPFYILETEPSRDIKTLVSDLSSDADIEVAQPDYAFRLRLSADDYYYGKSPPITAEYWYPWSPYLWHADKIRALQGWENAASLGEGIVVAVVDSGVDYTHEDLRANIWANPEEIPADGIDNDLNGYIDDVRGYDFVSDGNDPADSFTHGTVMAGLIAAELNNGIGVFGISPRSRIMALRAAEIDGTALSSLAAEAIYYAVAEGAHVINNSYSPIEGAASNPVMEAAVRYAYENGVVTVFAAGPGDSEYSSPQNMSQPLVVASSGTTDFNSSDSGYGESVDAAAPGEYVFSTINSVLAGTNFSMSFENKYGRRGGASASAAQVSALAALILSKNRNLSPADVEQIIKAGGIPLQRQSWVEVNFGKRIDVLNSLTSVPSLDRAAIAHVSNVNDRLNVDAILQASAPRTCQLFWKTSEEMEWNAAPSVQPPAMGVEFAAGSVDVSRLGESVVNLRLLCGELSDERAYYLDRLMDLGFFDGPVRTVLLGNNRYQLKAGKILGSTWTNFSLRYRRQDQAVWSSEGVSALPNPAGDLSDAALFDVDSIQLPGAGTYLFELTAQASGSGTTYAIIRKLEVRADPRMSRGWPVYGIGDSSQVPTVADLDGDNDLEIVGNFPNEGVQVLHHNGAASSLLSLRGSYFMGLGMAAGNIDGILGMELISPVQKTLHAYRGTAAGFAEMTGWPAQIPASNLALSWTGVPTPLITDLDMDGSNEIIALFSYWRSQFSLAIYNSSGTLRAQVNIPQVQSPSGVPIESIAVIDLDNDGQKEIVMTTQASEMEDPLLRAYRPNGIEYTGTGWPVNLRNLSQQLWPSDSSDFAALSLETGDIDGDTDNELVFANAMHELFVLEKNGGLHPGFPKPFEGAAWLFSLSLGDIDAMPGAEIVAACGDWLTVLNKDGRAIPGWPRALSAAYPGHGAYKLNSPLIADINGDGVQEIVTTALIEDYDPHKPRQFLAAWNSQGALINRWDTFGYVDGWYDPAAAIADTDRDGTLELIAVGRSIEPSVDQTLLLDNMYRTFSWKLTGSSSSGDRDWPIFRANNRRTSEYMRYGDISGDGFVTAFDAARAAQYAIGNAVFKTEQRQKAEVSGDGIVSAYDAALIARKSIGLLDRFPVEEK